MGSIYFVTIDPYEKYDALFNGAVATREVTTSAGRWAGLGNGWFIGLAGEVLLDFDKSIIKYPNIERVPGGASNGIGFVDVDLHLERNPIILYHPDNRRT